MGPHFRNYWNYLVGRYVCNYLTLLASWMLVGSPMEYSNSSSLWGYLYSFNYGMGNILGSIQYTPIALRPWPANGNNIPGRSNNTGPL